MEHVNPWVLFFLRFLRSNHLSYLSGPNHPLAAYQYVMVIGPSGVQVGLKSYKLLT